MNKLGNYFTNVSAAIMNNNAEDTNLPEDVVISGYNEQGFPILHSESKRVSTQFLIIDFSTKQC